MQKMPKKLKPKKAAKKLQPKVLVYTTPTCPYCRLVKQFLDRHDIKYAEKDVSKNHHVADDMMKKSGQMGVPVIIIGSTVIVGYDEAAMKKALKIK